MAKELVTKVEQLSDFEDEYVYDIIMEDSSTPYFFANEILVHNSCYFGLGDVDSHESAVEKANATGEAVNACFNDFVKRTFFTTEEFSDYIKAEREVVAKSGIFVTPKRYVLNVVDDEGKRVDKLKIMGLDIKKTSIPKFYQKALADFIGRFLRGEDWNEVARDVVQLKREISENVPLDKLGVPKGIQKVEFYTSQYSLDGPKARLPGHVAAAIHYNESLKHFKDKDSLEIQSGNKIYIYYLKHKYGPSDKFKSIALPVDAKEPPKWFIDHYQQDIDIKKQLVRLVDKPLQNILKAIGEESPTAQSVLANDSVEFI